MKSNDTKHFVKYPSNILYTFYRQQKSDFHALNGKLGKKSLELLVFKINSSSGQLVRHAKNIVEKGLVS